MKEKILGIALMAGIVGNASAISLSYTGTFSADDDVQLINFTANITSLVTLRSYSYAGGVQADGNVVSAGGFDPILALFDSTGNFIDENDDGDFVPVDPNTGEALDTELEILLAPGDYTVAIMQYVNFANGPTLGDGFAEQGNPFFTAGLGGCSNGQFCDISNVAPYNNRTNQWAFDVLNVNEVPAVPVPAAVWLFGSGLLGLVGMARRKKA